MAGSCRLATLHTQEVVPQGVLLLYRNSDFGPDDPRRWSGVNSRIRTGRRRTIRFYSPSSHWQGAGLSRPRSEGEEAGCGAICCPGPGFEGVTALPWPLPEGTDESEAIGSQTRR